jgi:hypothetical protein
VNGSISVAIGHKTAPFLTAILFVAACGTAKPPPPNAPHPTECAIAQVNWRAAEDDYDRPATIEALGSLESAIGKESSGQNAVAAKLDTLFRKPPSSVFLSRWTIDAAVRLRQLACAEQLGLVSPGEADQRYIDTINDIEDERAVVIDEMRRGAR